MSDIKFDEVKFNQQMNECRTNFFNSLSELLKNYKTHRTTPITLENQSNLDTSWITLTVSLNEIKKLKGAFVSSINILLVDTQTLDDDITNQTYIKKDLKQKLNDLSGSKESSIGMLDGSKIIRTHVLYGNYLLTLICIFMIVMLVKNYRNMKPSS